MKNLLSLLVCLMAGTGAMMACMNNLQAETEKTVTLTGLYGAEPSCLCPEEGEVPNCTECDVPYILVNGTKYFFNGNAAWEQEIEKLHLQAGDEIEVEGALFNQDCTDYIHLVRVKRLNSPESIENPSADPKMQQPMYNTLGQPVDDSYHGVIIQNGQKVLRK